MLKLSRDESGQSMVLGAISLLCVALVVFMTLQVNHVVHEKIRVQNYADERAYALAVQEARSFNYFAYANRGIAASYVSIAAMHAYYSEATMMADSYWAGFEDMQQVAAIETALCCSCYWGICCKIPHCIHAIEAELTGIFGFLLPGMGGTPADKIKALDSPFRNTVTALQLHGDALYETEGAMLGSVTAKALTSGSLSNIRTNSDNNYGVDDVDLSVANIPLYLASFDNNSQRKKRIMAEIANATRPGFVTNRENMENTVVSNALLENFLLQVIRKAADNKGVWDLIKEGDTFNFMSGSRSGILDSSNHFPGSFMHAQGISSDVKRNVDGSGIGSFDHGMLCVEGWIHGAGCAPVPFLGMIGPGELYTGKGNHHQINGGIIPSMLWWTYPHSGSHNNKYNMDKDSVANFLPYMEFQIKPSALNPDKYNQPSTFAAAQISPAKLMAQPVGGKPWPWLLNSTGKLTFDIGGSGGSGTVQLADPKPVVGVSKGLAYYHRFGDWRDYPNFWNPYWRAKLEPMTLAQATAITAYVNSDSVGVVSAIGATPVKAAVNLK